MNTRHSALALLVAVLWGVNFVAIDLGLHPDGAEMPPLLFVAMRFTLVVVPCIFVIRKPDVGWKAIVGVGLLMSAGQFGLLYLAMALGMPAGLASLVLQAQVLLTVLLAAGFLGERPSRRQFAGVVLGVAGLAVVAVGRRPQPGRPGASPHDRARRGAVLGRRQHRRPQGESGVRAGARGVVRSRGAAAPAGPVPAG